MIFGLTYQQVFPVISAITNLGSVVMPDMWNLNPYLFITVFTLMALLLFYMIDRAGFHRKNKE